LFAKRNTARLYTARLELSRAEERVSANFR
jgi:hypothetical protein